MPMINGPSNPQQRTIVLFDGQNVYHLAKNAWAPRPIVPSSPYGYPSYDVVKLANRLANRGQGRTLSQVRFYTGVPHQDVSAHWHGFWANKLRFLANQGVHVYRGRINPGGQEKGVDVSLAIDLIHLTYERAYEVAVIVSQDQDFGPAVKLAKEIARDQQRQLIFESAFPCEASQHIGRRPPRGIAGTVWSFIDKQLYDSCFDPKDYRM